MHTFKQSEFGYRKIPRQSRSQKTVEYILIAAEALVREHGSSDISTNKIAEKAGVNINSVYQYFSSKEAIFVALYARTEANASKEIREATLNLIELPISEMIPRVIDAALSVFQKYQVVLVDLVDMRPELSRYRGSMMIDNLVFEGSQSYIWRHIRQEHEKDLAKIFYVMQSTIFSAFRNYIVDEPERDTISRAEFIEELSRMMVYYANNFMD